MAIPSDTQTSPPAIHIDTDILRGMLDTTGKDDLYAIGRHISNSIRKTAPLGVSIPAIGETFHGLSEDRNMESSDCGDAAIALRKLVQTGKLILVGMGGTKEVYSIAQELMRSDDRLDPVDALILSVACKCKSCNTFYTTDGTILQSISIANVAKTHGVKIREPPFSEM